jgi:arylamine N-acetyltransferase
MSDIFGRYLRLLGVDREAPSSEALTRLVSAHLYRIPFENVSKLVDKKRLGFKGLPTFEHYLDGIEQYHFGGTCYTNNFYLYRLLDHLGYRIKLCGADMRNPDVHLVSIVEVDNREFLVDVGYAAPFDFPIPRDLPTDYSIAHRGSDQYILKPQDEAGRSQVELIRDGQQKHGYRVNPAPRQIEEFHSVIEQSYRPEATFMNALLLTRFYPNRSRVIHNLTANEIVGAESNTHQFANRDELAAYAEQHYGIPQPVLLDALEELGNLDGDPWN